MKKTQAIVSIIVGIFAIIGGLFKFVEWFISEEPPIQRIEVSLPSDSTGISINYVDEKVVSEKLGTVLYFRKKDKNTCELVIQSVSNKANVTIIDQKPTRDGNDGQFQLLNPRYLTLSPNQEKAYFTLEKYVTGSILVEVDIRSKKLKELFSVEKFEFIQSGKYKDYLLIGVSTIKDKGRDIYYEIKDLKGNTLKEFSDYDDYMEYRGSLIWVNS